MTATTERLQKGLNDARSSLAGFGKSVMSIKGLIAGSFAGAGIAALGHFAGLADDLSDNVERLGTMFSDSASIVVAQAERMNKAFGTSEISFTAMAVKMGGLFKSLGVAEGPAAEMASQLGVMGQALANFKGISFEQAMGKLQAGMAGKGKGLKEFGITVSATMSAQERFNAIMQGGAGILGTMDQRAMDAGASWASFRGRVEELEISLGKNLPELVEPFFAELNVLVVAAGDAFKGLKQTTLDWGEGSLEAAKSSAEGMGWVQKAVGGVADAWQFMAGVFHTWQANFTGSIAAIVDALIDLDKWLEKNLPELLGGGKKGENRDFLEGFSASLHESADKQFEDLQKEWAKPWSSEGIDAAFAASKKKIEEARKEVTKGALAAATPAAKATAGSTLAKSAGEALTIGSSGAASALIRSKYDIGDEGHNKKMAKNSDEQVKLLGGIKAALEAGDDEPEIMDDI
ncbi:MAG TPA: hypothetical protein VN627_08445 [Novosphingobium sp.]|nr:hypothetical protein [Novosphingobium sp.]